jgi:hypothetical protein
MTEIKTASELDALPVGSVVQSRDLPKRTRGSITAPPYMNLWAWTKTDTDWWGPDNSRFSVTQSAQMTAFLGPLTVLFRPDAPQPAPTADAVERAARALAEATGAGALWASPEQTPAWDEAEREERRGHFRAQVRLVLDSAAARAGEARYAGPTYEQVWQAITGRDEPWGGCADREAVERVMALLLPSAAARAGEAADREALLRVIEEADPPDGQSITATVVDDILAAGFTLAARGAAPTVTAEQVREVVDRYAQDGDDPLGIEPEDGWRLIRDLRALPGVTP